MLSTLVIYVLTVLEGKYLKQLIFMQNRQSRYGSGHIYTLSEMQHNSFSLLQYKLFTGAYKL